MPIVQIGSGLYAIRHYHGGRRTYHNAAAANLATGYVYNNAVKPVRTLEPSRQRLLRTRVETAVQTAPTLIYMDGFEHQTLDAARFGGGTGLYTQITNGAGMSFIAGRTGGSALRVASAATATRFHQDIAANGGHRIFSFYFRMPAVPSVQTDIADFGYGATGADLNVTTGGNIRPSMGGALGTTGPFVADNAWHLIDYYVNTSANPWVLRYSVDEVAQAVDTFAGTADTTNSTQFRLGHSLATASGQTSDYDDVVVSGTPVDYPIGPHRVLVWTPDHDGTHAITGGIIIGEPGSLSIDAATNPAWSRLDEWPANTSDYVRQAATGVNSYAEIAFPDLSNSEPFVWAVQAYAAMFSSGTTANAGTVRVVNGNAGGATVIDLYTGDMSETALNYRSVLIPPIVSGNLPPGNKWTSDDVDGLRMRFGFSGNVATQPRLTAVMIAIAVGGGGATSTSIDTDDSATGADDISALALEVDDAGDGADASITLTAAIPATDALVGTDTSALAAALATVTDTATGADVSSVQAGASLSAFDTAVTVDTSTAMARTVTESGSSTDTSSVLAGTSLSASDLAVVSDTTTVFTGLIEGFEGAAFPFDAFQTAPALPQPADITNLLPALTQAVTSTTNIGVFGFDAAVAIEAISGRAAAVSDAAIVVDVAPVLAKPGTDSATSTDVVTSRGVAVTDAAAGANVAALAAVLATATDTVSAFDSVPALARAVTDVATSVDVADLIEVVAADSAAADDTATVDVGLDVSDSATAADTAVMTNVPQNLIAVAISTNEIDLTWDVFAGAVAYDIERDGAIIAFDVPTNAYDDTGLSPDTLYIYRVRAVV